MKTHQTSIRQWRGGFSLTEVTLALGITALGISVILGLLPHGLDNIKKAGNLAAATRISQQILGSINQAQWQDSSGKDLLKSAFEGKRFYFDSYATPVDAASESEDVAFVAEVETTKGAVALPGAKTDSFLRRVTLRMKQTPAPDFDFASADPRSYSLYSYVVARTGK